MMDKATNKLLKIVVRSLTAILKAFDHWIDEKGEKT